MKLSLKQLREVVSRYIDRNKIAIDTFNATKDNVVGLLDKIGRTISLDGEFDSKLKFMDGDNLELGKTIEEYYFDLILPTDYDPLGAEAMSPQYLTARPAAYSYSLRRKKIKESVPNNNIERAVNSMAEFESITNRYIKRLYDSKTAFKNACKKEVLAKLIAMCEDAMTTTTTFTASSEYSINTYVRSAASGESIAYGVVVKTYSANAVSSWETAVNSGYIIPLTLVQTLAKPVDTETGTDFIKQVKTDILTASDISEGHSLNGNTLGAVNGLKLVVLNEVMPTIEVDVEAGAFHADKVAVPADIETINKFGSDASGAYAILMDARMAKLHTDYDAVRENFNGDGDFLNLFQHLEYTAFISKNCFVKVYKAA